MTRLEADPRDAAEPEAMAALLVLLQQGRALTPASTALLLEIMQRCETGRRRLRDGLPASLLVADKTGTLGRTANDVGIATLPDGTHLAIAVFVTGAQKPAPVLENAIAAAGRAAYELLARED
jgi:beta-lactamase class A